jgi:excisionase family DNA binding protein
LAGFAGSWSVTPMNSTPDATTPNMLADGPLLRPEEAADLLAVKTSWIYDAVRTGRLPCVRVGRHIRFTRHMLQEWLASQAAR